MTKLCKHGLPDLTEYRCKKCVIEEVKELEKLIDKLIKEVKSE